MNTSTKKCCFTGHRPEKLKISEAEVKSLLEIEIKQAISEGYTTFFGDGARS